MPYLIDYLENQFATFEEEPLNVVDAAVLSQMCMMRGKGMIPDLKERSSFANVFTVLQNKLSSSTKPVRFVELLRAENFRDMFTGLDPARIKNCLYATASSPRFRDIVVRDYLSLFDIEREMQFAAMTFVHKNDFAVVTFRGTDASITGWKEDFNMVYSMPVPAQEQALRYLEAVADKLPGKLYLNGHSKGGNLAEYAALKASPEIQARIEQVFILDGPGFKEDFFTEDDYAPIIDRMYKVVPEDSLIGVLLDSPVPLHVVPSNAKGFNQHSVFTWEVDLNQAEIDRRERLRAEEQARLDVENAALVGLEAELAAGAAGAGALGGALGGGAGALGGGAGALGGGAGALGAAANPTNDYAAIDAEFAEAATIREANIMAAKTKAVYETAPLTDPTPTLRTDIPQPTPAPALDPNIPQPTPAPTAESALAPTLADGSALAELESSEEGLDEESRFEFLKRLRRRDDGESLPKAILAGLAEDNDTDDFDGVMGCDFVYLEELSDSSEFVSETLRQWLGRYDDETRGLVIESLFRMLEATGADDVLDLLSGGAKTLNMFAEAAATASEEDKALITQAGKDFAETASSLAATRVSKAAAQSIKTGFAQLAQAVADATEKRRLARESLED